MKLILRRLRGNNSIFSNLSDEGWGPGGVGNVGRQRGWVLWPPGWGWWHPRGTLAAHPWHPCSQSVARHCFRWVWDTLPPCVGGILPPSRVGVEPRVTRWAEEHMWGRRRWGMGRLSRVGWLAGLGTRDSIQAWPQPARLVSTRDTSYPVTRGQHPVPDILDICHNHHNRWLCNEFSQV